MDSEEFPLSDERFEKNCARWNTLPVVALQTALHHVEPSIFNPFSLKALCPRGSYKKNTELLLRYVLFVSN
eukprot:6470020-Amphidinium_carterae.1